MKTIPSAVPVDAEQWRPGLEDYWGVVGFDDGVGPLYLTSDLDLGLAKDEETLVPVIVELGVATILKIDDYIIRGADGRRYVMSREEFELSFEPVL